jgi:hypothetical protein
MKIKRGLKIYSTGVYQDLVEGNLKPEEICVKPEDAQRVMDAVATIEEFEKSCDEQIKDFIQ